MVRPVMSGFAAAIIALSATPAAHCASLLGSSIRISPQVHSFSPNVRHADFPITKKIDVATPKLKTSPPLPPAGPIPTPYPATGYSGSQ